MDMSKNCHFWKCYAHERVYLSETVFGWALGGSNFILRIPGLGVRRQFNSHGHIYSLNEQIILMLQLIKMCQYQREAGLFAEDRREPTHTDVLIHPTPLPSISCLTPASLRVSIPLFSSWEAGALINIRVSVCVIQQLPGYRGAQVQSGSASI